MTRDEIKKIFPEAKWTLEGPLPAWLARHGKVKNIGDIVVDEPPIVRSMGSTVEYDQDHLFSGYAKLMCREFIDRESKNWGEQLMPWPWYMAISFLPGDKYLLEGMRGDEIKDIWLSYADNSGLWSGQLPNSYRDTLKARFVETGILLPKKPDAPLIRLPHGDLNEGDLRTIYSPSFGEIINSRKVD